jgi:Sec-independent protein secretion pathway component TatC
MMEETWYLIGIIITFALFLTAFIFALGYYATTSVVKRMSADQFIDNALLILVVFPVGWAFSLPAIALVCLGRIAYLLRTQNAKGAGRGGAMTGGRGAKR